MLIKRFNFMLREADSGVGTGPAGEAAAEPAPALPGTALAGEDPEPQDPPPSEGDNSKEGEPQEDTADLKPETPEGYALKFAEGTQVDSEILGQFQKTAHEMGLPLGQAQKMADLYAGHMAEMNQKYQEAQFQALNDYINTQNAELAKRPDFQKELGLARKTLKEFGSDELAEVFQQTAMGSHPAMFDFVVKVGKALGEPGFKGGPGRSADPPLYERIWGKDGLGSR